MLIKLRLSIDNIHYLFDGVIVATGGYLPDTAQTYVDSKPNKKILVAFGRRYVANPDLPFRIFHGLELNPYDRSSFYKVAAPDGFIDYPVSDKFRPGPLVAN